MYVYYWLHTHNVQSYMCMELRVISIIAVSILVVLFGLLRFDRCKEDTRALVHSINKDVGDAYRVGDKGYSECRNDGKETSHAGQPKKEERTQRRIETQEERQEIVCNGLKGLHLTASMRPLCYQIKTWWSECANTNMRAPIERYANSKIDITNFMKWFLWHRSFAVSYSLLSWFLGLWLRSIQAQKCTRVNRVGSSGVTHMEQNDQRVCLCSAGERGNCYGSLGCDTVNHINWVYVFLCLSKQ